MELVSIYLNIVGYFSWKSYEMYKYIIIKITWHTSYCFSELKLLNLITEGLGTSGETFDNKLFQQLNLIIN